MLPRGKVKTASDSFKGGVKKPNVKVGSIDKQKTFQARTMGTGGRRKQAGMLLDGILGDGDTLLGSSTYDAYNNSYVTGYGSNNSYNDIPVYFQMMNEQNGGYIQLPVTLREKYQWYRYFFRTEAYVSRSLELLADLPMSKITLNMPKMEGKEELRNEILEFFNYQVEHLGLLQILQETLLEYNMIGNCFEPHMRVHTPSGMVPICEIRKNDFVLTEKGRFRPVSAIARRGVREKLITLDIARLKSKEWACTNEHPVFVLRNNEELLLKASELKRGDYVSMYNNDEVVDIDEKLIIEDFSNGLLDGRYDTVDIKTNKMGYQVDVSYSTQRNLSSTNEDIRNILLGWLRNLDETTIIDCNNLAKEIGIDSSSRLSTVAYTLRKKGIIKTERSSNGKGGGSAIKWYPLKDKNQIIEFDVRNWKKTFNSSITSMPINKDFCYLFGYWLGDGWLLKYQRQKANFYQTFDICFEKNNMAIDILKDCLDNLVGHQNYSFSEEESHCNDNLSHLTIHDEMFCEWWGYHFGDSCKNKKMPQWLMNLPPEKLIWVLRGLIDSDGCLSDSSGVVSIDMTNEDLMQQVFKIGLKCGIPFSFTESQKTTTLPSGKQKECVIYSIRTAEYGYVSLLADGCVKNISIQKPKNNQPYFNYIKKENKFYFKINDIGERYYEGFVYNITVEEDHTYCIENVNTHNCFLFHEWDEEKKMWDKIVMLPPEEVEVFQYPFSDVRRVYYKPLRLVYLIQKYMDGGQADEKTREIIAHIPNDVQKMIKDEGAIQLDSDPRTGSFVHHIARRKSPYMDLGASILERVLVPLIQKEHYRYTQLALASRNMTPRNLITAPLIDRMEVDILREEIDLSMLDPDYSIITNYEVNWELIGSDNRLLELSGEYDRIENQIFAAMGVTRELLTGEGTYSGSKITIEVMNTMFMMVRDILQNYVEQKIFKPVSEARGWFEEKNGIRKYYYPKLGFNRITIRDNAEVFDSLFTLYQKGSLPIDIILELFNIDSDMVEAQLEKDLFTVKDSTFNRLVEEVSSEAGRAIAEKTNVVDKIVTNLGLKFVEQPSDEGFGGF